MTVPQRNRAFAARADSFLVGPGASAGERVITYGASVIGLVLVLSLAHPWRLGVLAGLVLVYSAIDLFGGVAANATTAARRRGHRPGTTRRRQFVFVAAHVHPLVLALVLPGFGLAGLVLYLLLPVAAVIILSVPAQLARPVAFAVWATASSAYLVAFALPAAVVWLPPLLLTKLLLSYLATDGSRPPDQAG